MLKHWRKYFALIWAGQTVSLITSSIVQYAFLWHLTALTKSPAVLSLASLAGFLPTALAGPFIGGFIDRHSRKAIMILADGCIAAVTLAAAGLGFMGQLSVPLIYFVLFLRALGSAFHTPCLQAVTPQLVPGEALARCNGYTAAFQSVSLIASPALAALLFAAVPLPIILLLDCIGAAAGISTVAAVPLPHMPAAPAPHGVLRDAAHSLGLLYHMKGLFGLTLLCCLFTFAYVPCSSFYPLMSMDYFGGTATQASIAEIAFSAGMLLGGLILGVWGGTKDKMITMGGAVLAFGAASFGIGFLPQNGFWLFAALTLVTGLTAPFFNSLYMTLLQEKVPGDQLGRVFSISGSIQCLAAPLGLAFAGFAAQWLGTQHFFLLGGALVAFTGLLCFLIPSVRNLDRSKTF